MAHWVGIVNKPERLVVTGNTKQDVIFEIGVVMTNRTNFLVSEVLGQLRQDREKVAIAYGESPEDILAKVFSCNCGSVIRHEIKPEGK